ncbi:MAG: hypothetical protein AAGH82_01665 [Pseudomonadota bacterium]
MALEEDKFAEEREFSMAECLKRDFDCRRYFQCFEFKYTSPWDLLLSRYFIRERQKIVIDRIIQAAFNFRTPHRSQANENLEWFVGYRLKKLAEDTFGNDHAISSIGAFSDFYGGRIFGHPNYQEMLARFNLICESLEASGDLREANGKYKATGRALNSLKEFELAERRHRDQIRVQGLLAFLTMCLVAVGILQMAA